MLPVLVRIIYHEQVIHLSALVIRYNDRAAELLCACQHWPELYSLVVDDVRKASKNRTQKVDCMTSL